MEKRSTRNFNCKNEELPVMCRLGATSLKRDLAEFSAYSPKFNEAYLNSFQTKIDLVEELVSPKSETALMKVITERLRKTMTGLSDPINRLAGYIDLAKETIQISVADFEINDLRKGITSYDVEKVMKSLKSVTNNIATYNEALTAQGLTPELTAQFVAAAEILKADKVKQYETLTNRKNIVQNNMGQLNELNAQLQEILKIGKILYKSTDPVKKQEYTFTGLKKQVHRMNSTKETDDTNTSDTETATE